MFYFFVNGLNGKGYVSKVGDTYKISPNKEDAKMFLTDLDYEWYKAVKGLGINTDKLWLHYRSVKCGTFYDIYRNCETIYFDACKIKKDLFLMGKQIEQSFSDAITNMERRFEERRNPRYPWDANLSDVYIRTNTSAGTLVSDRFLDW